jgi:hypothetical protein
VRVVAAILGGLLCGALILHCIDRREPVVPATHLVAEDASAPLRRIAVHYAPDADTEALPVYRQLLAALPANVEIYVEVARAADFDRFVAVLAPRQHVERVVVGAPITTWSRDRYLALADEHGAPAILAPPHIETPFAERAGDMRSPAAMSRALTSREPQVADFVFEGGDLVATPSLVIVDDNLADRNVGRAGGRAAIERSLGRTLAQRLVWLGTGVPQHHVMMYLVPVDDRTVVVGDVRLGMRLLGDTPAPGLADAGAQAARFDRAAALAAAAGFRVVRAPVLVLAGAGAYVTYTNALFDRRGDTRIVYLPTYRIPALDHAAIALWRELGFEVHPIDVSSIYELSGSLGCLVNVLARY